MEFIAAKCPNCGANINVPTDRDVVYCTYCGASIFVKDFTTDDDDIKLSNLIELGNEALKYDKNDEAYEYFNEALERDINNYKAWLGRARVLTRKLNIVEEFCAILQYLDKSINNCPAEDITGLKKDVSDCIYAACSKFWQEITETRDNSDSCKDEDAELFINRSEEIIDSLEKAYSYNNSNKDAVYLLLEICKSNIEGTYFLEKKFIFTRVETVRADVEISDDEKSKMGFIQEKYMGILNGVKPEFLPSNRIRKPVYTPAEIKMHNTTARVTSILVCCIFAVVIMVAICSNIVRDSDYRNFDRLIIYVIGMGLGLLLGYIIGNLVAMNFVKPLPAAEDTGSGAEEPYPKTQ